MLCNLRKFSRDLERLVDEIAINIILQMTVEKSHIAVLKQHDGPGNRNILLSYYYGCWSQSREERILSRWDHIQEMICLITILSTV